MEQKSLYRGHSAAILFGRFLDAKILGVLNNEFVDIANSIGGSSMSIYYGKEIECITSLLYYFVCLMAYGATLGQGFCGMQLFGVKSVGSQTYIPEITPKVKYFSAAVLYSILPYVFARRTEIMNNISSILRILMEPEQSTDVPPINAPEQETLPQRNVRRTIFSILFTSILESYKKVAHNSSSRIASVVRFFSDFHDYLFANSGRFLEFPLRLCNLELFSKEGNPVAASQVNISQFAWMIGARILLLTWNASRVLMNEIDHSLKCGELTKGESDHPDDLPNHGLYGPCPVCLESIKLPAVIQCGHVCCWGCIMSLTQGSTSDNLLKCPVCRTAFSKRSIRALHS